MIPLSVAPMMDRTDRHFRWLMRRISRRTLLYTEMVTTGAVIHGDRDHLLGFDEVEHPIAFQLGGDDPAALAEAARIVEDAGYDEVNLNVGCPSSRVQAARFGACLMRTPEVVAACVEAMRSAVSVEVTVKHRIGVDDLDHYDDMLRFVDVVADAGCRRFTVHARKAWLQGLSPKENRTVPPLRWSEVHRLKAERPELDIEINGGFTTTTDVVQQLGNVDGVMVGRGAYDDPWWFAELEQAVFGVEGPAGTREEVATQLIDYVTRWERMGHPPHRVLRHALNLFAGVPGAKAWKRALTGKGSGDGAQRIQAGLAAVDDVRTGRNRSVA